MATKVPWYKDYRFVVPIVVALIGLAGVLTTRWPAWEGSHLTLPVIVDEAGNPLPGALVHADEVGLEAHTDSAGRAILVFVGLDAKQIRITVSKDGFETRSLDVEAKAGMRPVYFTLKPKAPPTPEPLALIVVALDDRTEARIPGARVRSDEQGIDQETDSQGRCSVSLRPGLRKLRLTVEKSGYRTENTEIDLFPGMDPARVRLRRGR